MNLPRRLIVLQGFDGAGKNGRLPECHELDGPAGRESEGRLNWATRAFPGQQAFAAFLARRFPADARSWIGFAEPFPQ